MKHPDGGGQIYDLRITWVMENSTRWPFRCVEVAPTPKIIEDGWLPHWSFIFNNFVAFWKTYTNLFNWKAPCEIIPCDSVCPSSECLVVLAHSTHWLMGCYGWPAKSNTQIYVHVVWQILALIWHFSWPVVNSRFNWFKQEQPGPEAACFKLHPPVHRPKMRETLISESFE